MSFILESLFLLHIRRRGLWVAVLTRSSLIRVVRRRLRRLRNSLATLELARKRRAVWARRVWRKQRINPPKNSKIAEREIANGRLKPGQKTDIENLLHLVPKQVGMSNTMLHK